MRVRDTPADGVVIGHGRVNGRETCVYATDFTILAGSAGESHSAKIAAIVELAGRLRVPVVGLVDSAGARLHEGSALSRPVQPHLHRPVDLFRRRPADCRS